MRRIYSGLYLFYFTAADTLSKIIDASGTHQKIEHGWPVHCEVYMFTRFPSGNKPCLNAVVCHLFTCLAFHAPRVYRYPPTSHDPDPPRKPHHVSRIPPRLQHLLGRIVSRVVCMHWMMGEAQEAVEEPIRSRTRHEQGQPCRELQCPKQERRGDRADGVASGRRRVQQGVDDRGGGSLRRW